jgi:ComF family protein
MARSLYSYGGALAQVIQRYKYGSRLDLARPLGVLLAKALGEPHSVFSSGALVVPVPSSQMALGRRGFDPVMEILRTIDGLRWAPLLVRVDRREAQAALEGRERRSLGPEAFRPRGKGPVGEPPLVLVDDVLTTGATVRAAARALMALGARAIGVVTLARAEELPPGPSGVEVVLASSP